MGSISELHEFPESIANFAACTKDRQNTRGY